MRLALAIAVAVLTIGAIEGCGHKEKDANPSVEGTSCGDPRLEGTYRFVGTEMAGKLIEEEEKERIYTFSGDKMIPPKGKKEEATTIKCDPAKSPCEINLSRKEASGKVDTYYGIYKLEEDSLTLCMIKSDNPDDRPKEFGTNNTKAMTWILKKTK
jgi:uncharacterized protein (TIGR03067 family)